MAEGVALLPAACVAVIGVLASRNMVHIGRNPCRWLLLGASHLEAVVSSPQRDDQFMAHRDTHRLQHPTGTSRQTLALTFAPRCREFRGGVVAPLTVVQPR